MFLPERLEKCRKKLKLSLEEATKQIAIETGFSVSRQTLNNWETGTHKPTVDGLIYISRFYQKPMQHFFDLKLSKTGYVRQGQALNNVCAESTP